MKFNGEIKPAGPGFTVEVSMTDIPTMEQAREIGAWLHDAVASYLATKGVKLVVSDKKQPLILRH